MKRNYFVKLRPFLLVALFSFILIIPQWLSRGIILGTDSVFHYNRFYEAAMQIKHWNFSYFLSIYGFQQSGRIVNAVYGLFFAYFQGLLVLLGHTWFGYQLVSRFVLGLIAGSSMYALLKSAKIKEEISLPIALLYLTTFSIQYWTLRQGFSSWGAAVMPFCFIPAIRFTFYKEIHTFQLAFAVSLIFQIHLLSTFFLVIMYVPFFAYGFFRSKKKVKIIAQGLFAVFLTLLLTANVWVALVFLKLDNKLLDPFINDLMNNSAINTGSTYWITTPYPLVLFLIGQVIFVVVRWRSMANWKRILHAVYLLFILLSTSVIPWNYLVKHGVKIAQLIQFPFRFFIPATILLLLIGGIILNHFVKWRRIISWGLLACLLFGGLQTCLSTSKRISQAESEQYVYESTRHVHLVGTYNQQRASLFDDHLDNLLGKIRKSTPDYIPVYSSTKGYNAYDYYAEKVIFKSGFTKTVNDDGSLTMTWVSRNSQTELPVTVYKKTRLVLNGKVLTSKDYKLSAFGIPTVKDRKGVNKLTVSFTVPTYFTLALWLTIISWLGLAVYWLYHKASKRSFQVLLSD